MASYDLGDFGTRVGANPGFMEALMRLGGRLSADTVPLGAGAPQPGPQGGIEALYKLGQGGAAGTAAEAPGPALNMNVVMPQGAPQAPPSLQPQGAPGTSAPMPGLPQAQPGVSGPVRAPMAAPATRKPATPALAALRTAGGRGGGPMSLY